MLFERSGVATSLRIIHFSNRQTILFSDLYIHQAHWRGVCGKITAQCTPQVLADYCLMWMIYWRSWSAHGWCVGTNQRVDRGHRQATGAVSSHTTELLSSNWQAPVENATGGGSRVSTGNPLATQRAPWTPPPCMLRKVYKRAVPVFSLQSRGWSCTRVSAGSALSSRYILPAFYVLTRLPVGCWFP